MVQLLLCSECEIWRKEGHFERFGQQPTPYHPDTPTNNAWGSRELSHIRSNQHCQFCSFILRNLARDPRLTSVKDACVQVRQERFVACIEGDSASQVDRLVLRIYIDDSCDDSGEDKEDGVDFSLGWRGYMPQEPFEVLAPSMQLIRAGAKGFGRPVKRQIEFDLVQSWIDRCTCEHGEICLPEKHEFYPAMNFKVIDIKERRIVSAPHDAVYVALSYVWGSGVPLLTLTKSTKERLMQPGALADDCKEVPSTILDSILLCDALGIAFLWVDALCIQQDDQSDLIQVHNMDRIYGKALFTIGAISGLDSWGGLPGVRDNTREKPQELLEVDGLILASCQIPPHNLMKHVKWEQRGWTLQEKILSKRMLMFGEDQIFWLCNVANWWEGCCLEAKHGQVHLLELTNYMAMTLRKTHLEGLKNPREACLEYMRLACEYNGRALTNSYDALRAFLGVINRLRTPMDTEFHSALPLRFFDIALLSCSAVYRPSARRSNFPSWCWTGWKNSVPGEPMRYAVYDDTLDDTRSCVYFFSVTNAGCWVLPVLNDTKDSIPRLNGNKSEPSLAAVRTRCEMAWQKTFVLSSPSWSLNVPFSLGDLLVFETSSIRVRLRQLNAISSRGSCDYIIEAVLQSSNGEQTYIALSSHGDHYLEFEAAWADIADRKLELITIAYCLREEFGGGRDEPSLHVMLIETDGWHVSRKFYSRFSRIGLYMVLSSGDSLDIACLVIPQPIMDNTGTLQQLTSSFTWYYFLGSKVLTPLGTDLTHSRPDSGSYSGFKIICGEKVYNVHKIIICSRSEYFERAVGFRKEVEKGQITLQEDDRDVIDLISNTFTKPIMTPQR
ncbi:HET-domain-containing protein [Zopfia rhizophila CBS 207.26]|uniref:HET-domain-containing protein n=1 Tax=Zopfia rhizophila CBS 207.26 TaxID=1314779 RepID=A0A6A6DV66_9PEZI|nr:HET-domain-containing protein [Zopfia rhizophila CBS 207.26]